MSFPKNNISGQPRECTKVSYRTEKDAEDHISKLMRTSRRRPIPLRTYLCPICHTWHLTKRPKNAYENPAVTDLKKQLADLQEQSSQTINSLKEFIRAQKQHINELNQKISATANKERSQAEKEANVDARCQALLKTIANQGKTIAQLRKTNTDLIAKNLQLQKTPTSNGATPL